MVDYNGHLLVSTNFKDTVEFDNGNLSTINENGEDGVLVKFDLNNFSAEYIVHHGSQPSIDNTGKKSILGELKVWDDNLYLAGQIYLDTLNLSPDVVLQNYEGNESRALFYLLNYNLDSDDFIVTEDDTDGDGVFNINDLCPNTIEGDLVAKSVSDNPSDFSLGERVFHIKFGYGAITSIEGNKLTVDFEKAGLKKVIDSFVERH